MNSCTEVLLFFLDVYSFFFWLVFVGLGLFLVFCFFVCSFVIILFICPQMHEALTVNESHICFGQRGPIYPSIVPAYFNSHMHPYYRQTVTGLLPSNLARLFLFSQHAVQFLHLEFDGHLRRVQSEMINPFSSPRLFPLLWCSCPSCPHSLVTTKLCCLNGQFSHCSQTNY